MNRIDTNHERWEVEWTADVKEAGNPDSGTENVAHFKTEAEAVAFARTKIGDDYWGSPRVSLERKMLVDFEDGGPDLYEWEHVRSIEVID